MGREERGRWKMWVVLAAVVLGSWGLGGEAADSMPPTNLVRNYYKRHGCRKTELYVRQQVKMFWNRDHSLTPKLLRMAYSDCFVTGCDASILLDGPNSEKHAPQHVGLDGFRVIDKIKSVLETLCPGIVSCADIIQLAARDAVKLAGGPSYVILTGRRDGPKSSAASVDLPSPSISWEKGLAYFKNKGLDVVDYTTLLGAHTVGRTHCHYILDRLYNYNDTGKPDPTMKSNLLAQMRRSCADKPDPLISLNPRSGVSYNFTNSYYSNVMSRESILTVDQQLLFGGDTKQLVHEFAESFQDFKLSFALSMNRMGTLGALTGNQGEIRQNCRVPNSK